MAERKTPPKSLPHQDVGVRFLRERSAAGLFDEQGLGKSKQLVDAIAADIAGGFLDGALIICPNTLKTTWGDEIETHSSQPYAVFGAGRSARREAFRSLAASFYIINYEAVAAELPALRALLRFKRIALVLDESHRIKSPTAKVTRAVHSLRSEATKRFIMSGTPVANKPEDVWSQLFFLDDGATAEATFEDFCSLYKTSSGGYTRLDELRSRVEAISLRREKQGTVTLPPKVRSRVPVQLEGRQKALYETLRNELAVMVTAMSGEEVVQQAEGILARLVRLAQLASNPKLLDMSYGETPAKFRALDELLAAYMVDPAQKAIVWTSFVPNITELRDRYPDLKPVTLFGEMDGRSRDSAVRAFRADETVRLMVANPAAAREGLTLTSANVAIYLDRTFNLVDFLQSQDRIHRLSQTRTCDVVLLIATNTIDEFVDFSLSQKHRLARFTQGDTDVITDDDLELKKPELLRALLSPLK